MNVLFCNFDDEWHDQVIGNAARRIGADRIVSLSVRDLKLQADVEDYHWIDSRDFNKKIYSFMKDKQLPALDADLFSSLLWCETLYYPMLDRLEVESTKSISYHDRKRYYENDLQCMLWILQTYQIDLCVFSTIPHISFDFALYGLCKYLNIPTVVGYFGITIPHKTVSAFYMSDIFNPMPALKDFQPSGKTQDEIQLPQRMQYYYDHYGRNKDQIKPFVYYSDYVKPKNSKLVSGLNLVKKNWRSGISFPLSTKKLCSISSKSVLSAIWTVIPFLRQKENISISLSTINRNAPRCPWADITMTRFMS